MKAAVLFLVALFVALPVVPSTASAFMVTETFVPVPGNEIDLFIPGNTPFFADTVAYTPIAALGTPPLPADSELFLLDSSGHFVLWGDQDNGHPGSAGNFTSSIGGTILTSGYYYLWFEAYPMMPCDSSGNLIFYPFQTMTINGQTVTLQGIPVVPGGAFDHWLFVGQGNVCDIDTFTLSINGADPVPEPSTMFLLGFGLVGLAAYSNRFLRKA